MTHSPRMHSGRPSARHSRPASDARSVALAILNRLETGRSTLDAILEADDSCRSRLSHRDRALFNQLVYGVLRWRLRLDSVIAAYADRSLEKMAPTVLNILRLALFQILFMDRIPPSAAVNTAVNLARAHKVARAAGFINALLRTALRKPERFRLPDAAVSKVDHLAVATSTPHWLMARWVDRLGLEAARQLANSTNEIPPITVRCNCLKNELPDLIAALAGDVEKLSPLKTLPGAVHMDGIKKPIFRMKAFVEGRFAVQDAAAQLVSLLLSPQPGETVLDACAGLGGKTGHLAQLMDNRGRIVALDHVSAKLARLADEARRLGATIIETRQADLNRALPTDEHALYDRILIDAPCSGLGVLRRNPDAKWAARKQNIHRFADRQYRFLGNLAPLLRIGGVMVFSVCSMEPEENEAVVDRFLKNHPNFAIDHRISAAETVLHPFLDKRGFLRTFPHLHHMDGFFAARLTRTG
ncbi:ribosomal RNA small subunit methyltransferase B [Desulfosarcina ovata subsp. sediminis]|uniref:16S rRNA (cytosine(967)-C(5))-methyltransferase n=1 Tax=Desulfosarcina ovata subsp. sediminis TaxID=885957 RepID=A0A5K7ZFW4_9BACT|nr:16S rRNA (cytosine(967)-C(5))-methyltransferase RsmB [Desulfosarcina ovata]BBO80214.1 ribosomal RNA small subunit methyltransferase B [Desulfosarcina ovata subsp. sediminis]